MVTMRILRVLGCWLGLVAGAGAQDWNAAVLAATRAMPAGGGYATTSEAGARLRAAVEARGGGLVVLPGRARPSYCSGATYLVLLKVIEQARRAGVVSLSPEALAALPPREQRDGVGVWGRWNANGPGAACLFAALGAGRNFTDWAAARPGDFLKIFWRDAVGAHERGHLVVFFGTEWRAGEEFVRFWSSNKPGGYGEKAVPRRQIARALFSRLERPEAFARAAELPPVDRYLASLLERESSFAEACRQAGVDRPDR